MGKFHKKWVIISSLFSKNQQYFINLFIFNRNPNDPEDPIIKDIEWLPKTKDSDNFLNIKNDESMQMEKGFSKGRLNLWRRLL